jgi:DNA-binding NarL/FixJ family response regulator
VSSAKRKSTSIQTSILIVDDHPMMRQGLAALINNEPDLTVSAEAADAQQAMAAISARQPELVIADITLPDKSGLELIKDIQALHPGLRVLVVSMHDESLYAERVLRAGGRGYIMKQEGGRKLMEAIRCVLSGKVYVSEKMSARILELLSGGRGAATASPVERLTDREFEVFQLIGQGKGTREIAAKLHVSIKTIEVHRLHIKEKLELKTAPELLRFAVRWIESQPPG